MTNPETDLVRDRLQLLHDTNGQNLTAEMVVADAAPKTSVLHSLLEWDNKKAGHQYRLIQAREIIRTVHIRVETRTETLIAPAYIRNPSTRSGYTQVVTLRSDDERAREALVAEFVAVRGRLERARTIARALELEPDVERLISGVVELQSRMQSPSAMQ